MKKFLTIMLALVMMCSTTAFAGTFEGDFRDPFNNTLFEIVAEIGPFEDMKLDFVSREMVYNDHDDSLAQVEETVISYDGNYESKTITDPIPSSEAFEMVYGSYDEDDLDGVFNDGLTEAGEEDGCWLGGLKDINNKVKFFNATETYYGYDYNMGFLHEVENNGYMGPYIEEIEYKTTFTRIMTDGKKYEFNCEITNFNDDGYGLMRVDGKAYVIKLKKGIIPTVTYNGKKIAFDQIPVIEEGRTLVPLRAIFETFGAQVSWDAATSTVTAKKGDTEVKLTIDNKTAYKNGKAIELEVPAKIINGRTLVPVRFVSDCFDVKVEWDSNLSRVILTK